MTASILVPLLVLVTLALGLACVAGGVLLARRYPEDQRRPVVLAAVAVAGLVNLWWVALASLLFWKFVVLREDT